MAIEDDENNVQQEVQNEVTQQQEVVQDEPVTKGSSVDDALSKFIEDSTREPAKQGTPPTDPKAQQVGADGKPVARTPQQQQPPRQQPVQDQPVRGTAPTSRVREFGKRYYRDSSSNIVDKETNKVVAKAGAPYAVASGFLPYITKLETEIDTATTRMKAFEDARAIGRDAGLTMEEDALGTRLMVAYKKDPVATIKYLLTQAQEQGKDVSTLVGGQTYDPAPIINSMKQQFADALKPFMFLVDERTQTQEQQRANDEAAQQAQQEVSEFTEQFPDAMTQDAEIGALMAAQGWSMREAYFALKAHAAENRLDWSKPIGQQIAAKRAAPNGGGNNNRRELPPMNGRGGGQQPVRVNARDAAPDTDFGDIIKSVMAENGIEA